MKKLFLIIALLSIAGCATPYQKVGFIGGYSDFRLQENLFKVSFKGNGYTSMERAQRFAMIRCAELCLENGFNYFVIIDGSEGINTASVNIPQQTNVQGSFVGNSYYETSYTTGGYNIPIRRPETSYTIRCFKEKPEFETFDANQVLQYAKK